MGKWGIAAPAAMSPALVLWDVSTEGAQLLDVASSDSATADWSCVIGSASCCAQTPMMKLGEVCELVGGKSS